MPVPFGAARCWKMTRQRVARRTAVGAAAHEHLRVSASYGFAWCVYVGRDKKNTKRTIESKKRIAHSLLVFREKA